MSLAIWKVIDRPCRTILAPILTSPKVTGPLFEGRADTARCFYARAREGLEVAMPSVEDLIADRLGQHAVASPTDGSRLDQARVMLRMADRVDRASLLDWIRQESGEASLLDGYYPADHSNAETPS